MARTALTPVTPLGPYPAGGTVSAAALDLAFTAADTVNFNSYPAGGNELILVWNTDAAPHTVTFTSSPDTRQRSADITGYSVGAGVISAFRMSSIDGWRQGDGNIYLQSNSALVKFCVVKIQ